MAAEEPSHFCVAHLEAERTPEQADSFQALFDGGMSKPSGFHDFRGWRFQELFVFPKEFKLAADFSCATFIGEADFRGAHFEETADFEGVHFEQWAFFDKAHFEGEARFWMAHFKGWTKFEGTHFEGWGDFGGAHFEKEVFFWMVHFNAATNFREAEFKAAVGFDESNIIQGVSFDYATFAEGASFAYVAPPPTGAFDRDINVPPGKGESLYRLAKQIYTKMGLYTEAGHYHYMERVEAWRAKRQGTSEVPEWAARLVAWLKVWFEFVAGRLIFGYAEKPLRIAAIAGGVILVCGLLFCGLNAVGAADGTEMHGVSRFTNAMYFSVVTFTTLGFGDLRPIWWAGKLIAGTEALAGAFLMAAFLVTLARRWGRG